MPRWKNRFAVRCHCGRLRAVFFTNHDATDLPLRSCQCSFCRKHGARCTSDPTGKVVVRAQIRRFLSDYDSTKALKRLICRRCSIYIGMIMETRRGFFATLNVNAFDRVQDFTQPGKPIDYKGEKASTRLARRASLWTPTNVG